jgi:hypothetical protein
MRHTREEVIERTIREYEALDRLMAGLSGDDWRRPLPRPATKVAWTIKDVVAHITHWKMAVARSARGERRPPDERGLTVTESNHLVYLRWRDRSPEEVLSWHRQVHADVLAALRAAPDAWFSGKDRPPAWPGDLDDHSAAHRVADIERALAAGVQARA